ncbi:hypothetical protein PsYK624_010220 [Phanerochaete sordida]|uniref:DUF6532 domain-containing protein n=1 Tax=Phanerochaete sordida TaxID=48140 RepID=A0A9P3FYL2_9APHY|nr:hypothetical protein PsYK624_010220 [Phanerochaete sordida]
MATEQSAQKSMDKEGRKRRRAAEKAAEDQEAFDEAVETRKTTRLSRQKLQDDPTWKPGFERIIGDDGKPVETSKAGAEKGTLKGKSRRTRVVQDGKEGKAPAKTKDKAGQTKPKHSTPGKRPIIPHSSLESDDDTPLRATIIVTAPPRKKTAATTSTVATSPAPLPQKTTVSNNKSPSSHENAAHVETDSQLVAATAHEADHGLTDAASAPSQKPAKPTKPKKPRAEEDDESSAEEEDDSEEGSVYTSGSEFNDESSSSEEGDEDVDGDDDVLMSEIQIIEKSTAANTADSAPPHVSLSSATHVVVTTATSDTTTSDKAATKRSRKRKREASSKPVADGTTAVPADNSTQDDQDDEQLEKQKRSRSDQKADAVDRPQFKTTATPVAAVASIVAAPTQLVPKAEAEDVKPLTKGSALTKLRERELQAHEHTRLVWSQAKSGEIQLRLMDQQQHIMDILRDSFQAAAASIAFDCAVPDAGARFDLWQDIAIATAERLGDRYAVVVQRLKTDYYYAKAYVDQIEQRNSKKRSDMKASTDSKVCDEYGIVKDACQNLVAALVDRRGYAYPGNITAKYDGNHPFARPIVWAVLKTFFFHSTRKTPSVASQHPDRFKSSDRYKPQELEIPLPMLALTCAMIKLSLDAWSEGDGTTPETFNYTECKKEYDAVVDMVEKLREKSEKTYHRILHDVYLATVGGSRAASVSKLTDPELPDAVDRIVLDD